MHSFSCCSPQPTRNSWPRFSDCRIWGECGWGWGMGLGLGMVRGMGMVTSYRPSSWQKGHSKGRQPVSQSVSRRDRPQGSGSGWSTLTPWLPGAGIPNSGLVRRADRDWNLSNIVDVVVCSSRCWLSFFVLAPDMTARNMMKGPGTESGSGAGVIPIRNPSSVRNPWGFAFWFRHFYLPARLGFCLIWPL